MRAAIAGVDNGTTGTIGIIEINDSGMPTRTTVDPTPVKKEQSYTKKKQNITRLDLWEFHRMLRDVLMVTDGTLLVVFEQPYVNTQPNMIKTVISGHRCLEAQLCVIDMLRHEFPNRVATMYCTSRDWQTKMLGPGKRKVPEWKALSMSKGLERWPEFAPRGNKLPDLDGLWIAEWARQEGL